MCDVNSSHRKEEIELENQSHEKAGVESLFSILKKSLLNSFKDANRSKAERGFFVFSLLLSLLSFLPPSLPYPTSPFFPFSLSLSFFFCLHGVWDLSSQGLNLSPLPRKHGVLTTRLSGKSLLLLLFPSFLPLLRNSFSGESRRSLFQRDRDR